MELRPAKEARLAGAVSFAIPEVIVFPPQEEEMNEPCISYAPNESLQGLPNPHRSKPRSVLNAMLQLFTCLPNLNEELPVAAKLPNIAEFVKMVRKFQCDGNEEELARVAPAELVELNWWREACGLPSEDHAPHVQNMIVPDVEKVTRAMLDDVLGRTRFGRRFEMGLVDAPHPANLQAKGYGNAAIALKGRTDSAVDVLDSGSARQETTSLLTIPLADYNDQETVSLISLLNNRFGHAVATFFFGGPFSNRSLLSNLSSAFRSPDSSPLSTPNATPDRQIRFTRLPHYLTIHLQRPVVNGGSYHAPPIELPLEVDLGFYLENRHSDQKTFYRLHGFVTQTGGHFLTYTRLRGGSRWFKCQDELVQEVELGTRVESKGVVLVIYRLQEH
ncbi:uncharacterized protein SPPG_06664 [Spizellomyces punctatus DAOM BR117]|uniref:USP domain-containing protein n=1 Tax=Spizellomyces punctatus (strain DAOM BR117) TaxID=645134 RepID=A0A0L0HBF3_SPIPD|nr:uncharacterized protein SPPG_06664 [Spizellomyces punctatus DAOM BR117]KNC98266.1 hypothetical protein SPPG_06664 [Spizellomyces punctatus DAOM BR117]|eukprot:XP_016606306.1 hypothetical protein SPPG_06664 [Spizellomyces punctatus DAOM BR117]